MNSEVRKFDRQPRSHQPRSLSNARRCAGKEPGYGVIRRQVIAAN